MMINAMNAIRLMQPHATNKTKAPPKVSEVNLNKVYMVISSGVDVVNKDVAKSTGLSQGCVSRVLNQLVLLGSISSRNIIEGLKGHCYAYTAIKPPVKEVN